MSMLARTKRREEFDIARQTSYDADVNPECKLEKRDMAQ